MGLFNFLTKFHDRFGESCKEEIHPCDELREAVSLVVKLSHPNIHYVPDYREKLMPAVEHTLKFADDLILQMPAPVSVEEDSWDTNPFIRTVFPDNRQFADFFSQDRTLKEFFDKTNAPGCCALLVMTRRDRQIFGTEMEGELLKRDVLQTSIDFSDHQIVAPMTSEEETRKELSLRMLELLATHALEDMLSLTEWKKEMETQKHLLEMKLHIRDARFHSINSLFPGRQDTEIPDGALEVLEQLEQKIAKVRTETDEPEDYLSRVTDLLYHPEQFVRPEPIRMFVNAMNILVEDQEKGDEICFSEFSIGTQLRKAAALVDCKRF
ncbi:MAG: hypothetical protein R2941_15715 [Desulfobacterales bacterium]